MAVETSDVQAEIASQFLLNTCRLRPRLSRNGIWSTVCCATLADSSPADDPQCVYVPLTTGSAAEFYIEPMLSCVGDIDVMYHHNTELAIPLGHPPPTQLPEDFHSRIALLEIVDSEWPGYVYLTLYGSLTACPPDRKYIISRSTAIGERYLSLRDLRSSSRHLYGRFHCHGPAFQIKQRDSSIERPVGTDMSLDFVRCVRCLVWPPQAAEWSTRRRRYDWPDSATVDRIVSDGCDVVRVAHRRCREQDVMTQTQWRLSFSRAEVVLLNSWMPLQQVVYHMLRVFVKTEQLTDGTDTTPRILSNYHIKTLLLWASELKSRSWWTAESNLIDICIKLLLSLVQWLTDSRCQNYFIRKCNLFHYFAEDWCAVETVTAKLGVISKAWLSAWFINNYMKKCAQMCPAELLHLLTDVSTTKSLQNAASAVANWRLDSLTKDSWHVLQRARVDIDGALLYPSSRLAVRSCLYLRRQLTEIDPSLAVYHTAVVFLHAAASTARGPLGAEHLDCLLALVLPFHCEISRQRSSASLLTRAAVLLKVVANRSAGQSRVELVRIELAKAYLHRALSCKDSDSDSIYCLANVYLAALYYTTGRYQTAIDHCTLVARSRCHSPYGSHVVEGQLLPKVSDNVDSVLGLVMFYQYVRGASTLNGFQQSEYIAVFSTKAFAYYLKCLVAIKCGLGRDCTAKNLRHDDYLSGIRREPFITDVLLLKWLKKKSFPVHKFVVKSAMYFIPSVQELLLQSAVEHLTTFRRLEARCFGSVATIVTTDFEALYAYRYGEYRRCLQLCRQNVRALIDARRTPDVYVCPGLMQLMNDELVAVVGLALCVDRSFRDDVRTAALSQLTVSLYLLTQCQLTLRHSAASLGENLYYLLVALRKHSTRRTLDQLTLRVAVQQVVKRLTF